jgi:hypothetical protein
MVDTFFVVVGCCGAHSVCCSVHSWGLSVGVKQLGHESFHSPLCRAKVENLFSFCRS